MRPCVKCSPRREEASTELVWVVWCVGGETSDIPFGQMSTGAQIERRREANTRQHSAH